MTADAYSATIDIVIFKTSMPLKVETEAEHGLREYGGWGREMRIEKMTTWIPGPAGLTFVITQPTPLQKKTKITW